MGSGGAKRKGQSHLPKVDSNPDQEMRLEREAVERNLGIRPGSMVAWVAGTIMVIAIVLAIVALVALD